MLTYKEAGVNIDASDRFVQRIKEKINFAKQPWVLNELGLFSGMIDLGTACEDFKEPVLVQAMYGTSRNARHYTSLAYNSLGRYVIDNCLKILPSSAFKPISFLDYIGTDHLIPKVHSKIINGMLDRKVKIPIIGGETAEMPVIYQPDCITAIGLLTTVTEKKDLKKIGHIPRDVNILPLLPIFKIYKKPILVQSMNSLGTKSKEQASLGDSIRDILTHSKNDLAVHGAWPKYAFLYIDAHSKHQWKSFLKSCNIVKDEDVQTSKSRWYYSDASIVRRKLAVNYDIIAKEYSDIFQKDQINLVCAMSGLAEYDEVVDGRTIKPRDILIGLPSIGLHSNGFSLARKIFLEQAKLKLDQHVPELGYTVREEIHKPHLSYLEPLSALSRAKVLKGAAHITDGGIPWNLMRILPKGCSAFIDRDSLPILPVFKFIQEKGPVEEWEMFRVFNMGIGAIIVVARINLPQVKCILNNFGQPFFIIGETIMSSGGKVIKVI